MDIISGPLLGIILNNGLALTSSRITRIIQVRTLDDVSHIGAIDRLYDRFFRQGGKRSAITRLYRQLSQPDIREPDDLTPTTMVTRFMQLRAYTNSEYRKVFQLSLRHDPPEQTPWFCLMQICDYQIYQSPPLNYRLNNHFAEACTIKICRSLDDVLSEIRE